MKVKNVSGAIQVLLVGSEKVKFEIGESLSFDSNTADFLIKEFSSILIQDEYLVEKDKLLISEPTISEGQKILKEANPKIRNKNKKTKGE